MTNNKHWTTAFIALLAITLTTTTQAQFHPRLSGDAAFDDVLNITWLTNAGLSENTSWQNQLLWVAELNAAHHLGFNDWRLASMSVAAGVPTGLAESVVDCSTIWQPLCQDNELGYMFYHHFGGSIGEDLTGNRTIGNVTFTNVQSRYWSATESGITNSWMYHFDTGFGVWSPKNGNRYAWAVRSGDSIALDSDADGIADAADNCLLAANPDQTDSNADGFGNLCDPDLNNDNVVNFADFAIVSTVFLSADADADLNGDGAVNFGDVALMSTFFLMPPGPSGIAP